MPTIIPNADLRNNYNEISKFCHKSSEPVIITKNDNPDAVLLSIEAFEKLCGQSEFHKLFYNENDTTDSGKINPFRDAVSDFKKGLKN
jgi:prevent-host-death family protein